MIAAAARRNRRRDVWLFDSWLDGYGSWQGCKQAVDEFMEQQDIQAILHPVWERAHGSSWAVYLRKS